MSTSTTTIKLAIIGEPNVGKTTYINRIATGEFTNARNDVKSLDFNTTYGLFTFQLVDLVDSEVVILMVDSTQPLHENDVAYVATLPTVLVNSKVDMKTAKPLRRRMKTEPFFQDGDCIAVYDLSAKSNYNFEKPFHALLRHVTQHDDLIIIT